MRQYRCLDFRIGVNPGNVLVKDDAIYGNGVNITDRAKLRSMGRARITGRSAERR